MSLSDLLDKLIGKEGGEVDHPDDNGGHTKYGITEATARAFGYTLPLRDLTISMAKHIYTQLYWEQPRLNLVAEVSPAIAYELLDTGVNMGQATAGKFLQRSLNALNLRGTKYPDLVLDGNIGAMTIAALKAFVAWRGANGITVLLRMLNSLQGARYIDIAERDPKQETFVFGWFLNRVEID